MSIWEFFRRERKPGEPVPYPSVKECQAMSDGQWSQYHGSITGYLFETCSDIELYQLEQWRRRMMTGQIGGEDDGWRGCGGDDPQVA